MPYRVLLLLTLLFLAGGPAYAYSSSEKNAFLKADANADRKIDRAEFPVLIEELAAAGAEKAASVKKWGIYGMAFSKIDTNADGIITPPELEAQR